MSFFLNIYADIDIFDCLKIIINKIGCGFLANLHKPRLRMPINLFVVILAVYGRRYPFKALEKADKVACIRIAHLSCNLGHTET